MKAVVMGSYGPPGKLKLTDVAKPVPGDGEALVRVRATSVNPYDWHHVRGEPVVARLMAPTLGLRRPKITVPGCDVAGQVEATGPGVPEFGPGDEVFALLVEGGFAEYACVPAAALARKPASLSFEQAGAVPMAGLTALLAVCEVGQAQAGQRVLVNGASGGVGTFAVQLACALGAEVAGVCSAGNADLVRSLGATEVIDYRKADFTSTGQRYDLIVDVAGSRPARACLRALARTGTLVIVGGPAGRWLQPVGHTAAALARPPLARPRITMADSTRYGQPAQALARLATLMEAGKVTPVIDRAYPFAEISDAVSYQEAGHARGKVVVTI